jgi:hypothetical protein
VTPLPSIGRRYFREPIISPSMWDFRKTVRRFKALDSRAGSAPFSAFEVYVEEFHRLFPDLNPLAFFIKPITVGELAERLELLLGDGHAAG